MEKAIEIIEERIEEITKAFKSVQAFSEQWQVLYISRSELEDILKKLKKLKK